MALPVNQAWFLSYKDTHQTPAPIFFDPDIDIDLLVPSIPCQSSKVPVFHALQAKKGARVSLRITPGLKGSTKKDERAGGGEGRACQEGPPVVYVQPIRRLLGIAAQT